VLPVGVLRILAGSFGGRGNAMKKLKNEAALLKEAIRVAMRYAENRGAAQFEASDSLNMRVEYLYRLMVHDRIMQPLPQEQVSQQSMRHKLALWIAKRLPSDHPLLK
jgi:hypothetical protein